MPFDKAAYWKKYKEDNRDKYQLKRSPIKSKPVKISPVSKRRAKQYRAYTPIRKKFLEDHPECQAKLKGCTFTAIEIHHKEGKLEEKLNEVEHFLAVCRNCHNIVEAKVTEAKELNLSADRLKTT